MTDDIDGKTIKAMIDAAVDAKFSNINTQVATLAGRFDQLLNAMTTGKGSLAAGPSKAELQSFLYNKLAVTPLSEVIEFESAKYGIDIGDEKQWAKWVDLQADKKK